MSDPHFALGTFAGTDARAFAALVVGSQALPLAAAHALYQDSARGAASPLSGRESVLDLLEDWTRSFATLQEMVALVLAEGLDSDRFSSVCRATSDLRALPPVLRPSKILNCAANYAGHLTEMRQYTQTAGTLDASKMYQGDKSQAQPYLFLKAPSCMVGATDDIVMPWAHTQLDWEAELGVVIGARCRGVSDERALEHIAGYMTFNDVTARDELWREDRPNFRSDWFSSKSYDSFGPAGPLLVPRAFVPSHGNLRLTLKVNGQTKQDGLAGEMIYSPEEQIAYASRKMTLEPGDLFATGTLAGVGQASGSFLKPGDLVECEVHGLGAQRNRVVAAAS